MVPGETKGCICVPQLVFPMFCIPGKAAQAQLVLGCPSREVTALSLPEGSWNLGAAGTQRCKVPHGNVTWGVWAHSRI